MTSLFKSLNILKLADVHKLKINEYLHQLQNTKLPKSLYDDYVRINETHNYETQQVQNKVFFNLGLTNLRGKTFTISSTFKMALVQRKKYKKL